MNRYRKALRKIGNYFSKLDSSLFPSLLIAIFVGGLSFLDKKTRDSYVKVNFFNIGAFWSVFLESVVLVILLIFISGIIVLLFSEIGDFIKWASEHKIGNPVAKTALKVVELQPENSKTQQEFIVKVKNNENSDAYNVIVSFGIFGPINIKDKKQVAGNLNGLWIKKKDDNKDDDLGGEYRVNIPSGKERDLFFIKIDKAGSKFSIKFSSGEQDFLSGRYILKILLYGEMVNKQLIGEQSGELVFYDNGRIDFVLKKVKKNRGYISLVEEPLWKFE